MIPLESVWAHKALFDSGGGRRGARPLEEHEPKAVRKSAL
jgi:hypothetical protein